MHYSFAVSASYKPVDASIVMNADTGYIYESHSCHKITYPASLTKMMTLYLLFEALEAKQVKLTTRMPVSHLATTQQPSKLGLSKGQTLTVLDAIMSLVTKSANDAAVVIAEHLGGSIEDFAQCMTEKARYLKMKNTVFKNPSGLPNKAQRTTAYDMAKLAQALYKRFPNYYQYFRARSFIYKGQVHKNHNKLLGVCPGIDGVKTGYIAASGFNLAASAIRHNVRLIAVVMGGASAKSRDKEIVYLLNKNFQAALGQPSTDQKTQHETESNKTIEIAENIETTPDDAPNPFDELVIQSQVIIKQQKKLTQRQKNLISKTVKIIQPLIENKKTPIAKTNCEVHFGQFKQGQQAKAMANKLQKKYKVLGAKVLIVTNNKKSKKYYRAQIKNLTEIQANRICQDKELLGQKCKMIKR